MALIGSGSKCALCRELIAERPIYSRSGVWLPKEHRLFRYCDAPMHRDCYEAWPDRAEFARTHFEFRAGAGSAGAPVLANDDLVVFLGRLEGAFEVRLFLRATAAGVSLPLAEWEAWLEGGKFDGSTMQQALQYASLGRALGLLRAELPTAHAVQASADWEPVRPAEARWAAERKAQPAQPAERKGRLTVKTVRTGGLREELSAGGLRCPHCGAQRSDHRHSPARWPHGESYFICLGCGRRFTADDCSVG